MQEITLHDMRFHALVGILDHEREIPQPIDVDLIVTLDVAYVALGSSLGGREAFLAKARHCISEVPDCRILAESGVEETEAIGPVPQGDFLNQMLAVETSLEPRLLLDALHAIEDEAGAR